MKIVFFGTPAFAAHVLEFLLKQDLEIVGIVTRPDAPKGRTKRPSPSEVKLLAQKKCPNIPIFQPEKISREEEAEKLKALHPDVFVVVAYGEILKKIILDIPTKMCVNVHPSLLPKYRGAAPIQAALLGGESETGVTIIEMVLEMDAGDILETVRTKIPEDMTFGELEEILCKFSGPALMRVLQKISQNAVTKIPQNRAEATFTKKILPEDRMIDWKRPAEELHNQIRALSPKPGAFCFVDIGGETKRLVIKKTLKVPNLSGQVGSTLIYQKNHWIVACGVGALALMEVQLEGKKNLPITEFMRGISSPPNILV